MKTAEDWAAPWGYLLRDIDAVFALEKVFQEVIDQVWEQAATFAEEGSFLHDDAPAARMAKEFAAAVRRRGKRA